MPRPLKKLDLDKICTLAKMHCTYEEIAAVMGCCVKTLERRYKEIIDNNRLHGKSSLRRAMWSKAIDEGNVVMQKWLSEQHLDMKPAQTSAPVQAELSEDKLVINFTPGGVISDIPNDGKNSSD